MKGSYDFLQDRPCDPPEMVFLTAMFFTIKTHQYFSIGVRILSALCNQFCVKCCQFPFLARHLIDNYHGD